MGFPRDSKTSPLTEQTLMAYRLPRPFAGNSISMDYVSAIPREKENKTSQEVNVQQLRTPADSTTSPTEFSERQYMSPLASTEQGEAAFRDMT
jgi:hypothetical protein